MKTAKELQIGDWVYDDGGFTMFVQAIFDDDTVYLDFYGNEADTWEEDIKDIKPIPISTSMLKENGFYSINEMYADFYNVDDAFEIHIIKKYKSEAYSLTIIQYGNKIVDIDILYLHELQHALRLCKIEKEIQL